MKFAAITAVLVLPFLAVATPVVQNNTPTPTTVTVTQTATQTAIAVSQCNVGSVQCCDSTSTSSNIVTSLLLGLLGIVVQGVNVPIGVTCSPITVVGASGTSWYVQAPFNASGIYAHITVKHCGPCLLREQQLQYVRLILQAHLKLVLTQIFLPDGVVAVGCTPVNLNL